MRAPDPVKARWVRACRRRCYIFAFADFVAMRRAWRDWLEDIPF